MDKSYSNAFKEMMMKEIYENYIKCNDTVLQKPYPNDDIINHGSHIRKCLYRHGRLYCNATFDGYTCWDYAKAGTRTYGRCPVFLVHEFGHHLELPYKDCNKDGTWYRHPDTQNPWTDYSPCSETEKIRRAISVVYVYIGGYCLSVVSLILSLIIFTYFRCDGNGEIKENEVKLESSFALFGLSSFGFILSPYSKNSGLSIAGFTSRQLRCSRVSIHKHLFVSYILTAIFWVVYYVATSFNPVVLATNPVWCRVLHVLAQYVTVCNYFWMFCEGFYLHTILVLTFTNENMVLRICYGIGWGVPVIPTVIYSILRATKPAIDYTCWHKDSYLMWIFSGPVALSLLINVIFLVNILRILCVKVRSSMNHQDSSPLRQSLRATLILIPLLGVQYIVLPFRPDATDKTGQYVYDIVSACLTSFQGFLVALLFCFLNGEVLFLMKNQVILVRRRMSRTETGKSILYSAIHITDKKDGRKRSIQSNRSSFKGETPINNDHYLPEESQNVLEQKTSNV